MNDLVKDQIGRLTQRLSELDVGSEEYDKVLEEINTLVHIKKELEEGDPTVVERFISNPALVGATTTLIATVMVLIFERSDSITSRAFAWLRPR